MSIVYAIKYSRMLQFANIHPCRSNFFLCPAGILLSDFVSILFLQRYCDFVMVAFCIAYGLIRNTHIPDFRKQVVGVPYDMTNVRKLD